VNFRRRSLLVSLATLVGVGLTLALGRWQLQRAAYKEDLAQQVQARAALAPLPQDALLALGPELLPPQAQRRTVLRGIWLPEHTVALDNRQMLDKQGFFIMTPLRLDTAGAGVGAGAVVLVQRGWLPRNFLQRDVLLPFETPAAAVEVAGTIALAPARIYAFDPAEKGVIRQNLDLATYRFETGLPLRDFILVQQGPTAGGLLRSWPAPNLGVERHYGYAFQWFSLTALIAGLYFWFQWLRPRGRAKDRLPNDRT
jgi:surfeit locus 1 family protein